MLKMKKYYFKLFTLIILLCCNAKFSLAQADIISIDNQELIKTLNVFKKQLDVIKHQVDGDSIYNRKYSSPGIKFIVNDSLNIEYLVMKAKTLIIANIRNAKIGETKNYFWNYLELECKTENKNTSFSDAIDCIEREAKIYFTYNLSFEDIPASYSSLQGDIIFIGNSKNLKLNGLAKFYYYEYFFDEKKARVKAEGSYINNVKNGFWSNYYDLASFYKGDFPEFKYHNSKKVAPYLNECGEFKNGIKNGKWIEVERIKPASYSDFYVEIYNSNYIPKFQEIIYEYGYKDGIREGSCEVYTDRNDFLVKGLYNKNSKFGKWIYYNVNLNQPSVEVDFYNDVPLDTILAVEKTVKNSDLKRDLRYEPVYLNIFPIYLEGKHYIKFIFDDFSSLYSEFELKKNKDSYSWSFLSNQIKRDAYSKNISLNPNDLEKEARIILPRIVKNEYYTSTYSDNLKYLARYTRSTIELWDIEKRHLISSFNHKIEDQNRLELKDLKDDGSEVILSDYENIYYQVDFLNKTISKHNDEYSSSNSYKNISTIDKDCLDFDPEFLTLSIGYYNKKKRDGNSLIKIPKSTVSTIRKMPKYGYERTIDGNYLGILTDSKLYIYSLKRNKITDSISIKDYAIGDYKLLDSTKVLIDDFEKAFIIDLKYKTISYFQSNVATDFLLNVEIHDGVFYSTAFSSEIFDKSNGVILNLKNGRFEFLDKKTYIQKLPKSIRKGNKLKALNYKQNNLSAFESKLDPMHPARIILKQAPYNLFVKNNSIDTNFFCMDKENKDLVFINQRKNVALEKSVHFNVFTNGEFILHTPDQYYFGSKNITSIVKFELGLKQFLFEQFDLKYNRPDIILDRLGFSDSLTIAAYHSAYLKRLKKMGFREEMLKADFHLPELEIKNFEALPTFTENPELELDLNMNDSKYKLDRINVYINDVPIYGTNGINLRDKETNLDRRKIKMELAEGDNKIQISVLNQAGAESYKETIFLTYKAKSTKKPDLYLITIGDSKYIDGRYDLSFASKDAEDIKSTFDSCNSYNKVFTYIYTNEKVTKDKILALKNELQKAKRDDIVIITIAGHGVLDKELNYYLATYDMDFAKPEVKGLPYEELESLVDGIAPLKKVLFIDACHSGEIDKEEVESIATNTHAVSNIKFRATGAGIQKKNIGLKTTSELVSELFADLRKGTGATVISSASGLEYAMESDQWKNGLFTYCLLHGLKDKAADLNRDGAVMLSELQKYLGKEVAELSNGSQRPTSRMENVSMDFRIW